VGRILSSAGLDLDVKRAYDGQEGLAAMRAQRPDLVLLDLIMPEVDGFQVLEEMRQDPNLIDVPVILVTAMGYAEDALMRRGSRVVIHRPDNLHLTEVFRCLKASFDVLEPRYNERSIPQITADSRAQANVKA
jgi:CheY-like chemotaxis protein